MAYDARALRLAAGVVAVLAGTTAACTESSEGAGTEWPREASSDTSLRRLAAELLPAAEGRSGLPARGPIRLARRSKDELEEYLIDEMARQLPPDRLEATVRTYARLGLVPDTLDLEPLLRSLLLEQVVGYYDPGRDTLYVIEGADDALVRPVLVHEIVHALQDQYMDLDSMMRANREANDRAMASQAAVEGHATFAMLEWQLAALAGGDTDLTVLPDLQGLLGDDPLMAAGMEMPVLSESPAIIRESLLFPYLGGLVFVQRAWSGPRGRVPPLGGDMPASTEQVLHPGRFEPASRDLPTGIEFGEELPPEWREVLSDGLGELETRVLLREFLPDRAEADRAAAGWDGDRYRLLEGPAGEVFVWVTVWDSDRDALEFGDAVRRALETRYDGAPEASGRAVNARRDIAQGRPVVIVRDVPTGASPGEGAATLPSAVLGFVLEGGAEVESEAAGPDAGP